MAVIDAQASSVLALGDHPGLRGRAVLEPGDTHATLLREEQNTIPAKRELLRTLYMGGNTRAGGLWAPLGP